MTSPIATISTGTQTAISQDRPTSSCNAMATPPTHMIGAATSIVHETNTSIWTCCTSFVLRVISDGAPNRLSSRAENSPTRWNTAERTSRPKPIAVRAPKYTAATEHATWSSVTASIQPPVDMM